MTGNQSVGWMEGGPEADLIKRVNVALNRARPALFKAQAEGDGGTDEGARCLDVPEKVLRGQDHTA